MDAASKRVVLAHPSPFFRDCLAAALSTAQCLEVILLDPFEDGAGEFVARLRPDALVIDVSLPESLATQLISSARESFPGVAVIALGSDLAEGAAVESVISESIVCIPENASLDELRSAIAIAIDVDCDESSLNAMTDIEQIHSVDWAAHLADGVFTTREREVLCLIAESNLSSTEVARRLQISQYAVKNHVHEILDKLSAVIG